jgi:transcriptional regulator with XRE-family HTH domain
MTEAWLTHRAGLARKGQELRTTREAAGLTQTQLCDTLADPARQFPVHTEPSTISRIETGMHVPPAELGLALSLWMQETCLQTSLSVQTASPAWSHPNRRFDTPTAAEADPVPSLFDVGLAPVPVKVASQDTIQASFEAFHQANPWVYTSLVRLARDMREQGHKTIGIGMLWEVFRWQYSRATTDAHSTFALNNNLRSRYARLIMDREPDLDGIFEIRKLTAL